MYRWLALAGVLIASCLGAAEIPSAGTAVSLEEFTRHDEFGELKLSPDGQVVAAMAGKYGRGGLVFLGVKDRKLISGIQAPKGFEIFDFEWVSDTRVIYFVAKRQVGEVYPTRFADIFAVDRDGRNGGRIYTSRAAEAAFDTGLRKRRLSYARAKLISTLENDDRHILIAEYAWIERSGGVLFRPQCHAADHSVGCLQR